MAITFAVEPLQISCSSMVINCGEDPAQFATTEYVECGDRSNLKPTITDGLPAETTNCGTIYKASWQCTDGITVAGPCTQRIRVRVCEKNCIKGNTTEGINGNTTTGGAAGSWNYFAYHDDYDPAEFQDPFKAPKLPTHQVPVNNAPTIISQQTLYAVSILISALLTVNLVYAYWKCKKQQPIVAFDEDNK